MVCFKPGIWLIVGCAQLLTPFDLWAQQPARPAAQQAQKMPVIGYLIGGNPEPVFSQFKEGLRKIGYVDGKNVRIEFRSAEGKLERLPGLAAELVELKVNVLVAAQTPAQLAAKQASSQLPIVLAGSADPVATGLIASLARPGGNITGVSNVISELGPKSLELIREAVPSARRVAVLVNPTDPYGKVFLASIQAAGEKIKLNIVPVMIGNSADLETSFPELIKQGVDAVIVQPSVPRKRAAELSLKYRLASFSSVASFTGEGGLVSYGADPIEQFERTASFVDKILKGARPADLPVSQPTRFQMTINLQTAKALGLTIPKSLLLRADQLIE